MKKLIWFSLLFALLAANTSCGEKQEEQTNNDQNQEQQEQQEEKKAATYGEEITADGAMNMTDLLAKMEATTSMSAKVRGNVIAACEVKGCWMNLERPDGEIMRVTFKDDGFIVPTDFAVTEVVIEGLAYMDTTSVDMLKHFAEDEGLPQEEIDAITEDKVELVFEATGVLDVSKN